MILDSDVDAVIVCRECATYLNKLLKASKIDKDIIVESSDDFSVQLSEDQSENITSLNFNKTETTEKYC